MNSIHGSLFSAIETNIIGKNCDRSAILCSNICFQGVNTQSNHSNEFDDIVFFWLFNVDISL